MDSSSSSPPPDANGAAESPADSPVADAAAAPASSPPPAAGTSKGRGLRRWRRIPRDPTKEDSPAPAAVAAVAGGADEEAAQLHKRRLPGAADAPKSKEDVAAEDESSAASVESRIVGAGAAYAAAAAAPAHLDPDLGLLIASAGFSVGAGGADSDNSEDRSSKSSTAASAPRLLLRHDHTVGFGRERDRTRGTKGTGHGGSPHARALRGRARGDRVRAAEAENSRSSVESDLRSSNAAARARRGATSSNGIHKPVDDGEHSDEGQQSEEVRSTTEYYKENGSAVGSSMRGSGDFDADGDALEGSVGKGENGGTHSRVNPYVESMALLQTAQEALENEIQKFVEIAVESGDTLDTHYEETEWSNYSLLEEPVEKLNDKIKNLECKLEEASAVTKEKDSRLLELEAVVHGMELQTVTATTDIPISQSDLDQLLEERMEAEIQCLILTRASQSWKPFAEDQIALHDEQKSLCGDYEQLGLKLRHAENRAMMLEEMAEKLEARCNELFATSEVLSLQSSASRVSLVCFIQLVLLCIAVGSVLTQLSPSSTEVVPT